MLDGKYLVFDGGFIEAAGGWVAVEEGCGAWVFKGRGGDSAKARVAGGGAALDGESGAWSGGGGAWSGGGGAGSGGGGAWSGGGGRLGKRFRMIGERRASRLRSAGVVAVARGPSESRARGKNAELEPNIQEIMTRFRRDPSRYRIGILREGGSAAAAGAARRLMATAGNENGDSNWRIGEIEGGASMRILFAIPVLVPLICNAEECFFFQRAPGPTAAEKRIEGERFHLVIPIKKLDSPKASSIWASHQGLGPGREYQIQINLINDPPENWHPMLKLGDDVIDGGIILSYSENKKGTSALHLQSDDPARIQRWCELLGDLLKLPPDGIVIDLSKEEETPTENPGTSSESKAEADHAAPVQQRDKQAGTITEAEYRRYREQLNQLLINATQANDFEEASKVLHSLKDLAESAPATKPLPKNAAELAEFLDGTTWNISDKDPDSKVLYTLTFNKDGTFKHSDGRTGALEFLGPRMIKLWNYDPATFNDELNQFRAKGHATIYFGNKKQ